MTKTVMHEAIDMADLLHKRIHSLYTVGHKINVTFLFLNSSVKHWPIYGTRHQKNLT